MNPDSCSHIFLFVSHLMLMMTILCVKHSLCVEAVADNTDSEKFSTSDTYKLNRQRRAPGWGKRNLVKDEYFDESESALEELKNNADFREAMLYSQETPLSEGKRAPGWGKRAPGWGKRSYRLNVVPGLNRNVNDYLLDDEDDYSDKIAKSLFKRAPGWGKRNYAIGLNEDGAVAKDNLNVLSKTRHQNLDLVDDSSNIQDLLNAIASMSRTSLLSQDISVDRRAPGWGKRDRRIGFDEEDSEADKRAPGWGKRAPGWGKRFDATEFDDDLSDNDKRAPGWGKRAPGWGKRSVASNCQDKENMKDEGTNKVVDRVSGKCGNQGDSNKASRK